MPYLMGAPFASKAPAPVIPETMTFTFHSLPSYGAGPGFSQNGVRGFVQAYMLESGYTLDTGQRFDIDDPTTIGQIVHTTGGHIFNITSVVMNCSVDMYQPGVPAGSAGQQTHLGLARFRPPGGGGGSSSAGSIDVPTIHYSGLTGGIRSGSQTAILDPGGDREFHDGDILYLYLDFSDGNAGQPACPASNNGFLATITMTQIV